MPPETRYPVCFQQQHRHSGACPRPHRVAFGYRLGWLMVALIAVACPAMLSGCGPSVDRDELGEVIFTLPKVPGADQPFPMPEPYFSEPNTPGPQPAASPSQSSPQSASPSGDSQQSAPSSQQPVPDAQKP